MPVVEIEDTIESQTKLVLKRYANLQSRLESAWEAAEQAGNAQEAGLLAEMASYVQNMREGKEVDAAIIRGLYKTLNEMEAAMRPLEDAYWEGYHDAEAEAEWKAEFVATHHRPNRETARRIAVTPNR